MYTMALDNLWDPFHIEWLMMSLPVQICRISPQTVESHMPINSKMIHYNLTTYVALDFIWTPPVPVDPLNGYGLVMETTRPIHTSTDYLTKFFSGWSWPLLCDSTSSIFPPGRAASSGAPALLSPWNNQLCPWPWKWQDRLLIIFQAPYLPSWYWHGKPQLPL